MRTEKLFITCDRCGHSWEVKGKRYDPIDNSQIGLPVEKDLCKHCLESWRNMRRRVRDLQDEFWNLKDITNGD